MNKIRSKWVALGVASTLTACIGTPSGGELSEDATQSLDTASAERLDRTGTATVGALSQAAGTKPPAPSSDELSDHEETTIHPSANEGTR